MQKRNNLFKALLCLLFILILNFSPIVAKAEGRDVYLGGFPAGFIINTTKVEVVGVCDIMTENGMASPARDCGIKSGDIIKKINGIEIKSTNDVNYAVEEDFKSINIEICRKSETFTVETNAVNDVTCNKKKLGLLIKDSINGIGTVTFIDKSNNYFASLGHPVLDENNKLQEINGGKIYGCFVYEVRKGLKGTPGELRGIFENNNEIGSVNTNSPCGVYGKIKPHVPLTNLKAIKTAYREVTISRLIYVQIV